MTKEERKGCLKINKFKKKVLFTKGETKKGNGLTGLGEIKKYSLHPKLLDDFIPQKLYNYRVSVITFMVCKNLVPSTKLQPRNSLCVVRSSKFWKDEDEEC